MPFGVDVLAEAGFHEREAALLRNQFTVGSGAADAPVIAMGTEEGYEAAAGAWIWLYGIAPMEFCG